MDVQTQEGGRFIVYAYGEDAAEGKPPRLIVSIGCYPVSASSGFISPGEARKVAAALIAGADEAEGVAAEVLDVLGEAA